MTLNQIATDLLAEKRAAKPTARNIAPLTIVQEMAIRYLCERSLSSAQIGQALGDVSRWRIDAAAAEYRKDYTVALYRDGCLARVRGDPHKHEAMVYLYVRGVPARDIGPAIGISMNRLRTDPEAKRRYQARQVEIVRAAVAAGREL